MERYLLPEEAPTEGPGKWEFPGGKVEPYETQEDCLKREILEEFDVDIEVGSCVGENIHGYDFGTIKLVAFRAVFKGKEFELNAHDKFEWAPISDLNEYDFAPADVPFVEKIRRGEIDF